MTEIIFECYGAPSLSYGIDSLFSYRYNQGKTGLVVSSSYSSTHVIPVYNSKAMLAQAIRLNWGGWHAAEYLLKLVRLKYKEYLGNNVSFTVRLINFFSYVSRGKGTPWEDVGEEGASPIKSLYSSHTSSSWRGALGGG